MISFEEFVSLNGGHLALRVAKEWQFEVDDSFIEQVISRALELDEHHLRCAIEMLGKLNRDDVRKFARQYVDSSSLAVSAAARDLFDDHFRKGWISRPPGWKRVAIAVSFEEFVSLHGMQLELRVADRWQYGVDDGFIRDVFGRVAELDEHHLQCAIFMMGKLNRDDIREFVGRYVNSKSMAISTISRNIFEAHLRKGWICQLPDWKT